MCDFIHWCNYNQGFLSALLSVVTVAVSLYALFISTRLQKKLHKKSSNKQKSYLQA